jgi:hypothetical protein
MALAVRSLSLAAKYGRELELWTAEGERHSFFNHPPWRQWTLYLTDRFLQKHGYLEGKASITPPEEVTMERMSY